MEIGHEDLIELCRRCFRVLDMNERYLDIPPPARDTSGPARTEVRDGSASRSRSRRGRVRGRRREVPEPVPTMQHDVPYIPDEPVHTPSEVNFTLFVL